MRKSIRKRPHLAREIIATLVIKVIFIYFLWYTFFSDPIDETLTPEQCSRLAQAPPPTTRLGERRTSDYLLFHVFGLDPANLDNPATLVIWLGARYRQPDPLSEHFTQILFERLSALPV